MAVPTEPVLAHHRSFALGSTLRSFAEILLALALGLSLGAGMMALWGFSPERAYRALLRGAFGDLYGWADTLVSATPLILTGLTFAIGVRAGLFNIGAQGQMYVGALAAVASGLVMLPSHLHPGLHLVLTLVFAMAAGALWSLPAALLKSLRGVHEVISTIMLNWIGWWLALYLASSWLVDPNRAEKTIGIPSESRFSVLLAGTDLTAALFVAVLFAVIVYLVLWHTVSGYELRAAGLNPDAARYGGIHPGRTMTLAFVLGGLSAGLAGAVQVVARPPTYALYTDMANIATLGFDGIAVALVGRNHPLGVIFSAIFFGALATGARLMQIEAQVPLEMIRLVQGAIILTIAAPELWRLLTHQLGRI